MTLIPPDQLPDRPARVWIHGSSLGDINALTALIESLEARGCELTLSASTASGRARIAQRFPTLTARRAPLWSGRAARRVLGESGAELLILETLEWWPAWLRVWRRAGVRVIVVDGRVSPRTVWARPLLAGCARSVTWFLAQTHEDAARAQVLGVSPHAIAVCGDAKIDSAIGSFERTHRVNRETHSKAHLILSCIRPRDERPALEAILNHRVALNKRVILIAPRHIERVTHLSRRAQRLGFTVRLISSLDLHQSTEESSRFDVSEMIKLSEMSEINEINERRQRGDTYQESLMPTLWILDRYGDLAWRYRGAHSVIMGGTFYDRGQGLIEPALAGCAVIYGGRGHAAAPQRAALRGAGGYQVNSWEEAVQLSVTLSARPRVEVGAPRGVFKQLSGALERQLVYIERTLDELR